MRPPQHSLVIISVVVVLVMGVFLLSGPAAVRTLTIDPAYILVRADVDSRTVTSTYRANVINPGPTNFRDVTAILTSRSVHTVVINRSLTFGAVPAGQTVTSRDTFTIR